MGSLTFTQKFNHSLKGGTEEQVQDSGQAHSFNECQSCFMHIHNNQIGNISLQTESIRREEHRYASWSPPRYQMAQLPCPQPSL